MLTARAGQVRQQQIGQAFRIAGLDVVGIQPEQLFRIEDTGRAPHIADVKLLDHLFTREDLVIAVTPPQTHQIIHQRLGQKAHVAVGDHAGGAVTLGETGLVAAQDHRHMGKLRHRETKRLVELDLARGVVDMVVAADNGGDPHDGIIDHHAEVVGRRAVRALDDQIVQFFGRKGDAPLDQVIESDFTSLRCPEADDIGGCPG